MIELAQRRLAPQREHVHLGDVRDLEQRLERRLVDEVVERERKAGGGELARDGQQLRVDGLALEQLEHHSAGRERQRTDREQ
jgi:hypothetical protein